MELVSEDVKEQIKQSLENIKAILTEAGYSLADVVKIGEINERYTQFFTDTKPARVCIEVAKLSKNVKMRVSRKVCK